MHDEVSHFLILEEKNILRNISRQHCHQHTAQYGKAISFSGIGCRTNLEKRDWFGVRMVKMAAPVSKESNMTRRKDHQIQRNEVVVAKELLSVDAKPATLHLIRIAFLISLLRQTDCTSVDRALPKHCGVLRE